MAAADDPEYQKKHYHMRKANGKARDYYCQHCDGPAEQWAQVHDSSGWDPENDYLALCRSCHRKYDMTDETKAKIGNSNRGKKRTPEQIQTLSLAHMGNSPSEETRKKLSKALKGKPWSDARKAAQSG